MSIHIMSIHVVKLFKMVSKTMFLAAAVSYFDLQMIYFI